MAPKSSSKSNVCYLQAETLHELHRTERFNVDMDRGTITFQRNCGWENGRVYPFKIVDGRERLPAAIRDQITIDAHIWKHHLTWPVIFRLARLSLKQRQRIARHALEQGDLKAALGVLRARRS